MLLTDHQKAALDNREPDLQLGYNNGRSPNHATIMLVELIVEVKDWKAPLFIGTLDLQKAFNTVAHNSILKKLFAQGLPPTFWCMKQEAYNEMTTKITCKGTVGEPFLNVQGNRQGGAASQPVI